MSRRTFICNVSARREEQHMFKLKRMRLKFKTGLLIFLFIVPVAVCQTAKPQPADESQHPTPEALKAAREFLRVLVSHPESADEAEKALKRVITDLVLEEHTDPKRNRRLVMDILDFTSAISADSGVYLPSECFGDFNRQLRTGIWKNLRRKWMLMVLYHCENHAIWNTGVLEFLQSRRVRVERARTGLNLRNDNVSAQPRPHHTGYVAI
jgi:hypothetical protein